MANSISIFTFFCCVSSFPLISLLRGCDCYDARANLFFARWPQYPEIFDVRIHPRVITSQTGTKELQQVTVQLRVLSRPQVELLPKIFRELGKDFDERVLPSICNEVLKATVVSHCLKLHLFVSIAMACILLVFCCGIPGASRTFTRGDLPARAAFAQTICFTRLPCAV